VRVYVMPWIGIELMRGGLGVDAWLALLGVSLVGVGCGFWSGLKRHGRYWAWFVGLRMVGWPEVTEVADGDEPESLILAQSERWRNA
jgi:hypothetical protein